MSDKRNDYRNKRNRKFIITDESSPLFDEFEKHRTCDSKNRYDSEWQAQFVIDETEKKSGTKLDMYQCPFCNCWHLTERK